MSALYVCSCLYCEKIPQAVECPYLPHVWSQNFATKSFPPCCPDKRKWRGYRCAFSPFTFLIFRTYQCIIGSSSPFDVNVLHWLKNMASTSRIELVRTRTPSAFAWLHETWNCMTLLFREMHRIFKTRHNSSFYAPRIGSGRRHSRVSCWFLLRSASRNSYPKHAGVYYRGPDALRLEC